MSHLEYSFPRGYGPKLMGESRGAVLLGPVYNLDGHAGRDEGPVRADGVALDRAGPAQGGDGIAVLATRTGGVAVLGVLLQRHVGHPLYSNEQGQRLTRPCRFRAFLTDLKPCIPLSEIDVDPTPPPQLIPHCLARASYHTAKYLKDYVDPRVDMTTEEYITSTETGWMEDLKALRHGKDESTPRSQVAWAEFRYSW